MSTTFALRATAGILRLACHPKLAGKRAKDGADDPDRTGDLVLTKDVLCQLSYIGLRRFAATADKSAAPPCAGLQSACTALRQTSYSTRWLASLRWLASRSSWSQPSHVRRLERETGIEP